jgi:hypothetical protein
MGRDGRDPYQRETSPFILDGEEQFVEVAEYRQRVRCCRWPSREVIEEVEWPVTRTGCYIHQIAVSPSGNWLVTQRISGQGEWGYDVFRTRPLARVSGVVEEKGYILDLPAFSPDESCLVGGAGPVYMGGWWRHPDDEVDDPPRGGVMSLGFLFVHRLPTHEVSRHELQVELPTSWRPDDPWAVWYGPREIESTGGGVRFMPSWGVPVEVRFPLPCVIPLPVPHPSGTGLL